MMKKLYIVLILLCLGGLVSCEKYFLQKPDTTGITDEDEIYSSSKNAFAALMSCYRQTLNHGWPTGVRLGHQTLASMSAELSRGCNWNATYSMANSGMNASDGNQTDNFETNWSVIRACFLVKENIERVPDMTDQEKEYIRAECTALIAYRYMGMLIRYGGVPRVEKAFSSEDDLFLPRETVENTVDYILELCDEAYEGLPAGDWEASNKGRMTRGAVLAIRARTLLFAARPLFNSATPYMNMSDPADNTLICYGNADASRWQDVITANEAVLTWATANGYSLINTGGAGEGNANPNAAADYGTATSTPSNQEVLLAFKINTTDTYEWSWGMNFFRWFCTTPQTSWDGYRYDMDNSGIVSNHLEKYYKKDGTEQDWPKVGEPTARDASDWLTRINEMEDRLLVDFLWGGVEISKGNPGNTNYNASYQGKPLMNSGTSDEFPNAYNYGQTGRIVKFYYGANGRTWFEPPLFRLAETYLNLAEAYNEAGQSGKALENLNKVHNRAGLPAITTTDQGALRKIIQRERNLELFLEAHKYFDAKHWMIDDIATGGLCGPIRELQYHVLPAAENLAENIISYWESVTYNAFWAPYMYLEPFLNSEVNKGIMVQNPGY